LVAGSKQIGSLSKALVGERSPGKRGVIPTAVLGTGVLVSLTALDTQILGGRLTSIFSLSTETIEMLDNVDNKSETVQEAVKYYLLNKDKPVKSQVLEIENKAVEL